MSLIKKIPRSITQHTDPDKCRYAHAATGIIANKKVLLITCQGVSTTILTQKSKTSKFISPNQHIHPIKKLHNFTPTMNNHPTHHKVFGPIRILKQTDKSITFIAIKPDKHLEYPTDVAKVMLCSEQQYLSYNKPNYSLQQRVINAKAKIPQPISYTALYSTIIGRKPTKQESLKISQVWNLQLLDKEIIQNLEKIANYYIQK